MHLRDFSWLALSVSCSMALSAPSRAQDPCASVRIVGGVNADIKRHAWQVAVEVDGDLCGGVLIGNKDWVLTAAHCFDSEDPRKVRVKAGQANYRIGGAWTQVDRVVLHNYNRRTKENDLALLKLRTRPTRGESIPLPSTGLKLAQCQLLEVTGWGQTVSRRGAPAAQVLQKADVPYIDNATCNGPKSYNGAIRDSMICAGSAEKDACLGDSGGPLVLRNDSATDGPVLVGIVSFGSATGCAKAFKYGVYTRVEAHLAWIRTVTTGDQTR